MDKLKIFVYSADKIKRILSRDRKQVMLVRTDEKIHK